MPKEIIINFAKEDKLASVMEALQEIQENGTQKEKCVIMKSVELESDKYKQVSNDLLNVENESLWEGIGGKISFTPELKGKKKATIRTNPNLQAIWHETKLTKVVEVCEKGTENKFYIDTAGWSFARHVGFVSE